MSERLEWQLEAERDYLLLWIRHYFDDPRPLDGLSAKELTRVAFGQERREGERPHDRGDLGRCERAFDQMPRHLQERCGPLLKTWREDLSAAEQEKP